jgi:arsenate reductase-like glutaredoxin family protein
MQKAHDQSFLYWWYTALYHHVLSGNPKHSSTNQHIPAHFRHSSASLRLSGSDAADCGLADADDDAIIAAMVANPAYVNRPFVETGKGVRFCRPQDVVHEIL